MQALSINSTLQGGKYIIREVLGQGGFGITYMAERTIFGDLVAIKEFFFQDYCERSIADDATMTVGSASKNPLVENFKRKFVKEAQTIHSLEHPNIVKVYDVFEENGTAYYVMECIEGDSLANIVKYRGHLSEREAIRYIKQVGNALNYLHSRHINHLDVKPANIMVRKSDNRAILIDFGTSKVHDIVTSDPTTTTPVGVSHGYAPIEQYRDGGVKHFSAQTDIYSLGATLYKLVTGQTPPDATTMVTQKRLEFPKSIGRQVMNAITKAMASDKDSRPSSVSSFLGLLEHRRNHISTFVMWIMISLVVAICLFVVLSNNEVQGYVFNKPEGKIEYGKELYNKNNDEDYQKAARVFCDSQLENYAVAYYYRGLLELQGRFKSPSFAIDAWKQGTYCTNRYYEHWDYRSMCIRGLKIIAEANNAFGWNSFGRHKSEFPYYEKKFTDTEIEKAKQALKEIGED